MDVNEIPSTIPELLRRRAELTPEGPAFSSRSPTGEWMTLSWQESWDLVQSLAHAMRRGGISSRDRVALFLPTSDCWELVQQAVLLTGAVVIGIDLRASREEIQWTLSNSDATCLMTFPSLIASRSLCDLKDVRILGVEASVSHGKRRLELRCEGDQTASGPPGLPDLSSRQPATLIYTSGTTGRSKAIEYTHGQIMLACRELVTAYAELGVDDRTLCWLPMPGLFQRMANLHAIARGMRIFFIQDPRTILNDALELKPTFLIGVPRFYEKLLASISSRPNEMQDWLEKVKFMVSGSAPLARSVLQDLHARGLLVLEAYGFSENVVPIATNTADSYRFGSVGMPLRPNEVRFASDGEILVRGPGLCRGYYGEPAAERFTSDGYYRTGDCGYLDDEGKLYLTGRKAEFLKTTSGRRISPSKVEATYSQSALIDQIAVFGHGRKAVLALLVLNASAVHQRFLRQGLGISWSDPWGQSLLGQMLLDDCESLDRELAAYERVRLLGVLSRPFSVERREITLSSKMRRQVIEANYQHLIKRLCEADPPSILFESDRPAVLGEGRRGGHDEPHIHHGGHGRAGQQPGSLVPPEE